VISQREEGKGPALRGTGPGLGPRGKREGKRGCWPMREREERGERGKEMGREKSWPKGFCCFPSFPYTQTFKQLFEFK
jgi:hypothetical protein